MENNYLIDKGLPMYIEVSIEITLAPPEQEIDFKEERFVENGLNYLGTIYIFHKDEQKWNRICVPGEWSYDPAGLSSDSDSTSATLLCDADYIVFQQSVTIA